ncbi:MAG: HD domain-containing phosphohydrolase, partial [Fusobacteriaceae bacterium]
SDVAVVGRRGARYIKESDDLRGENIGIVLPEHIEYSSPKTNLSPSVFKDLESALKALKTGEIDYLIGDFIFLDSKIENMFLTDGIKFVGFLKNLNSTLFFTFKKEDKILHSLFLQLLPKNILEFEGLRKILVSPKIIRFNYHYLAWLIMFFLITIGSMTIFLKSNIIHKNKAEKLNKAMITSLEIASSYNDDGTGQHIVRVAKYAELLGKRLNLSSSMVKDIAQYASLHDIGKIGIPDSILRKPGKLTPEEIVTMREHSNIGYKLVKNSGLGKTAENLVRFHHERWDGKGYPVGLKGVKIPIEARIVALADVYDALRQKRSYKEPYTHEEAVQIITSDSEVFFDPEIVEIFLKHNKEFEEIYNNY